ncbi:MAG: ABC transporter substrate-binding protein [Flavobacteriales bacterium]
MKFFAALLFTLLLLSGCSRSDSDESNVFRYNESNGITSLDPAFARDLEIMWATNQLFDGLIEMDDSLHIQPCIAHSWTISQDGLQYTFHLRSDVRFHPSPLFADSTHRFVTADDFVYSFNRILDPQVASPGAWIFASVDSVAPFTAVNDSTLLIKLQKPFQPFLGMLSMQYCSVVPHEVVEHYGQDFRSHPIGTGPFQFAFWYENIALVFHKNKNFWQRDEAGNALPYLDAIKIDFVKDMSVEYQGLLMDRYDFMSGIHPAFKDELLTKSGELNAAYASNIAMHKMPFIKTDYLGIMIDPALEISKNSPLLDVRIRKAIELAIDKNEMVKYLRNNTVVAANAGFVPPALIGATNNISAYDPEKARQLLAEAGFPDGKNLPELTISTTSDYADLIEYMQHQLAKVGIRIKVQVMQGGTFREASSKGQLQIFRKSWLADYPDAENFLSIFTSKNFCPSGPNYAHYSNPEFDVLYNKAVATTSDSLRSRYYIGMNNLIGRDVPVIPLYYDQVSHFVSNRVQNWSINPINLIDLKKVRKLN